MNCAPEIRIHNKSIISWTKFIEIINNKGSIKLLFFHLWRDYRIEETWSFEFNLILSLASSSQSRTKDCPQSGYLHTAEWFSSYVNFRVSAGLFNGSRQRVDYRRKFTRWHNFRAARCSPKKASLPSSVSVARPFVEYPGKFINHRLRKRKGHRSIWRTISNPLPPVLNFSRRICYHSSRIFTNQKYLHRVSWNASRNKFKTFLFLI